jgi:tetratricopeptide (TPR) repeat protein
VTDAPKAVYTGIDTTSFKAAYELKPDFAPPYAKLIFMYRISGEHPDMLLEADHLVHALPRCYRGYQARAEAWASLQRREPFEKDIATAISLRPGYPELYDTMGSGYESLGDWVASLKAYQKALELGPTGIAAYNRWNGMGRANEGLRDYQSAISCYEKALHEAEVMGPVSTAYLADYAKKRISECQQHLGR